MATRSYVALECDDDMIRGVYVHWDGYLTGVGKILLRHYARAETAELIALGDVSVLEASPLPGHTKAYARDMGETYTPPEEFKDENRLCGVFETHGVSYLYLLKKDGTWRYTTGDRWENLTSDLTEKE